MYERVEIAVVQIDPDNLYANHSHGRSIVMLSLKEDSNTKSYLSYWGSVNGLSSTVSLANIKNYKTLRARLWE